MPAAQQQCPNTTSVQRNEHSGRPGAQRLRVEHQDAGAMAVWDAFLDVAVLEDDSIGPAAQEAGVIGDAGRAVSQRAGGIVIVHNVCPGDVRAASCQGIQPGSEHQSCFVGQHADLDVDSGGAQRCGTTFAARCGVDDRDDGPGDPGIDEPLAAGWRAALVVAGLQGDDGGPALGTVASRNQGVSLSVRLALALVVALPDDSAGAVQDDAAHRRVGTGGTEAKRREGDCPAHGVQLDLAGHQAGVGWESWASNAATGGLRRCGMSVCPKAATMVSVRLDPAARAMCSASAATDAAWSGSSSAPSAVARPARATPRS